MSILSTGSQSRLLGLLVACLTALSCARSQVKGPIEAMRPYKAGLKVVDDLQFQGLKEQLIEHINYFRKRPTHELQFGPKSVSSKQYLAALEDLNQELDRLSSDSQDGAQRSQMLAEWLGSRFEVFEVYGAKDWGDVFITGYFDPVIEGRRLPDERYFQPVYGAPQDMVSIDLDSYADAYPRWRDWLQGTTEQKSDRPVARGRLFRSNGGGTQVRPYFTRREIDSLGMLYGKAPIIAYVDPIDSFFMQIQGSATIRLENGQLLRVGYAAQNGHPYDPIGKFLRDEIPIEKMSMQTIEQALRAKPWPTTQRLLELNPSYVFFQKLSGAPQTTIGTKVYPGRTVATDRAYFPKGALAWLLFDEPIFESSKQVEPIRFEPRARLVVDQDTGGAIRGPGRVDFYFGSGSDASQKAGVMKGRGRLYYLVPKVASISENR